MKALPVLSFLLVLALGVVAYAVADQAPPAGPQTHPAPHADGHDAMENQQAGLLHTAMEAAPAATPEPQLDTATHGTTKPRYYRSYAAPTGLPGFRHYYQIRCYPGCHTSAEVAVPPAAATATAEAATSRPYRSYPAPTGEPGFRRYYQIRCYPGCHSYAGATPVATRVHP